MIVTAGSLPCLPLMQGLDVYKELENRLGSNEFWDEAKLSLFQILILLTDKNLS
jgi:hypothetical protein